MLSQTPGGYSLSVCHLVELLILLLTSSSLAWSRRNLWQGLVTIWYLLNYRSEVQLLGIKTLGIVKIATFGWFSGTVCPARPSSAAQPPASTPRWILKRKRGIRWKRQLHNADSSHLHLSLCEKQLRGEEWVLEDETSLPGFLNPLGKVSDGLRTSQTIAPHPIFRAIRRPAHTYP